MVDAMFDPECNMLKIGVTNSISRRAVELQSKYGQSLRLVKAIPGGRDVERSLHRRIAKSRIPGTEWFHVRRSLESWVGQPLTRSGRPRPEDAVDSGLQRCVTLVRKWTTFRGRRIFPSARFSSARGDDLPATWNAARFLVRRFRGLRLGGCIHREDNRPSGPGHYPG